MRMMRDPGTGPGPGPKPVPGLPPVKRDPDGKPSFPTWPKPKPKDPRK
jgi:hypothetical protein